VLDCADFDDTIGVNGWPLELHMKGDVEFRWTKPGSRGFNQLPYRMIVPPDVDNLWVAGAALDDARGAVGGPGHRAPVS
jgi:hypothetical protein